VRPAEISGPLIGVGHLDPEGESERCTFQADSGDNRHSGAGRDGTDKRDTAQRQQAKKDILSVLGGATGQPNDRSNVNDDSKDPADILGMPCEDDITWRTHWRSELKLMLQLALPCILANTSTQLMVITNQIFVGHLGVDQFAAAALANTVRRLGAADLCSNNLMRTSLVGKSWCLVAVFCPTAITQPPNGLCLNLYFAVVQPALVVHAGCFHRHGHPRQPGVR
jgi:hypothetical protein